MKLKLPKKSTLLVICISLLTMIVFAGLYWTLTQSEIAAGRKMTIIPVDAREVRLLETDDNDLTYSVAWRDGSVTSLNPSEYARLIESEYQERSLFLRLLNVTSSAGLFWVSIGLLAQGVFMARMLVQWVASEKNKRSVVPPMFWWLSLMGASMLIVYFIWRQDAIGVLGQATGWVVYIRNLILLRRESLDATVVGTGVEALDQEPAAPLAEHA
jgi:lipid-A-disaccharide synthase-like uncharacterized protein